MKFHRNLHTSAVSLGTILLMSVAWVAAQTRLVPQFCSSDVSGAISCMASPAADKGWPCYSVDGSNWGDTVSCVSENPFSAGFCLRSQVEPDDGFVAERKTCGWKLISPCIPYDDPPILPCTSAEGRETDEEFE